ncbi:hypothetical protein T261_2167 [Streptomyces lydicus]|nr:hypothetical protein T261_2167 [Streptomyces lydicus]
MAEGRPAGVRCPVRQIPCRLEVSVRFAVGRTSAHPRSRPVGVLRRVIHRRDHAVITHPSAHPRATDPRRGGAPWTRSPQAFCSA